MIDTEAVRFADRADAGSRLARLLAGREFHDPLVLAIPRGGVVIGEAVARAIGAELDVVLVRKLRSPFQEEYAIGALAEDGTVVWNAEANGIVAEAREAVLEEMRVQEAEIARRRALVRAVRPEAPVAARSVIVVDDGIATGSTLLAALRVIRAHGPREIVVAVPVAAADSLFEVREACDDVVCVAAPRRFRAIGEFYDDFAQVTDEEVAAILTRTAVARDTRT